MGTATDYYSSLHNGWSGNLMSLRNFITDIDLQKVCADMGEALWDEKPIWPPVGLGLDGVISDVNEAGTEATFTSATGNFSHVKGGDKNDDVPVGTMINLPGRGIYEVSEVVSNVELTIKADANRPSMAFALETAENVKYLVGGYTDQIQLAFEDVWVMCGMTQSGLPDPNPLCFETSASLVDKAIYIPNTWHGADKLIIWGAIKTILFSAYRNNESSYKDKYDEASDEYERAANYLTFVYDFDSNDEPDTLENNGQTTLSR